MKKNLIKAVYEHCKKSNNTALEKDIDAFVKKNKLYNISESASQIISISEGVSKILEKHGILNENGKIIETKVLISESKDILPYLKKCGNRSKKMYESAISIIDRYSVNFGDKKVIFKNRIKDLNEALSYMEHRNSRKINEGLEDLSNLPINEGSFDFDNYEDFLSTFDEKWLSEHKDQLDDLDMWFNNGGHITMNIFSDENTLTGFNASLSWANGESVIQNHQQINSLVKKYISDDIADSIINESQETGNDDDGDDFELAEYHIGEDSTPNGVYQIIESDNDEFIPFDLIEIKSRDKEEVVIKTADGEEKTFKKKDLESVEAVLYKDYDAVMECLETDTVLNCAGVTPNDLQNLILNNNICYDEVTATMSSMMADLDMVIQTPENGYLHYDGFKFVIDTVDEFGNSETEVACEDCVVSYIIFYLVQCKEKDLTQPASFGYECKFDTTKTFAAVISTQDRIQGDCLASFVEDWNEIVKFADAGDPNADYAIENILMKYEVEDLAVLKDSTTPSTVKNNDFFTEYSPEEVVAFLHKQFEGISEYELETCITQEKASEFTKMNNEFYLRDENLENDDDVADRYCNELLDFMKSAGVNISLYR